MHDSSIKLFEEYSPNSVGCPTEIEPKSFVIVKFSVSTEYENLEDIM